MDAKTARELRVAAMTNRTAVDEAIEKAAKSGEGYAIVTVYHASELLLDRLTKDGFDVRLGYDNDRYRQFRISWEA